MLERLSFTYIVQETVVRIEEQTDYPCLDFLPLRGEGAYFALETDEQEDVDSKTAWKTAYRYFIHAYAPTKAVLYAMIEQAEVSLRTKIALPPGYDIERQAGAGKQKMEMLAEDQFHAKIGFETVILHGDKMNF
ncbi:DUF5072 family protein [Listeria costaricensis]|uniref:DUF5072 family protein n=1 Tax=Listeria costaricensis TaxID=2026604 RepID=UPI000C083CB0|nr:DUF5072 family protein [Listeria costaricensis]